MGQEIIAEVQSWISSAERVVVLTGAGISTDSGIADFRGPQGAVDHLGNQLLAEGNGVALEDAAAVAAVRVLLARAHTLEHGLHRAAHAAAPAHEFAHRAVHLDHLLRRIARDLMQFVNVLGDQRM